MSLVIRHLYENPELLSEVGDWIYQAFWADQPGVTVDDLNERLKEAVNGESVPLSLVAFLDGKPVGTVNLIESDDEARPHLKPWLAALFVMPEFRNAGVGAELVKTLLAEARRLGIKKLYLGTERPDFYARLGAIIHEMASPTFVIMTFEI